MHKLTVYLPRVQDYSCDTTMSGFNLRKRVVKIEHSEIILQV